MGESFDWNYPDLHWSHFPSLANLLSLRNGGQAEPSSLANKVLEEDPEPDDNGDGDGSSIDTRLAHRISHSGHERLKQRFLDCLAEFAANKKGGTAVACSAMKEAENNVIIWIARNEGFSDDDTSVFDHLGKLLGSLACSSAGTSENLLWEEMVLYHQNRIKDSYIPNLRASFKAYDAYDAVRRRDEVDTPENTSSSDTTLSGLRTLLFDRNMSSTSTLEKHTSLAIAAYNLRRTRSIEEVLYSCASATSRSKSLWSDICLLARLRVAFQNFKDIALKLPSFEQVTIILVPRPPTFARPSQPPLNLKQTFDILELELSPATTKAILDQNWSVAKTEREFAKRQKQKPNVHAEVQMLVFLNTDASSASGLFPYLGCSKLSCFMCSRFIQSYGRFATRGCHGRLFKPWTVPSVDQLLPAQADRTAKALIAVQKDVETKLKVSLEGGIRLERTSVIGGSSVLGGRQEEHSRPLTSADYLWMSFAGDLMPEEEDVLEDFGFNNLPSRGDWSSLLGLYRGLYLSGQFSPELLHEWRVGGILTDKIKEFYYSIPEDCRGQYFPWFLKNTYVLERSMTKDEVQQRLITSFYDKARPYLDFKDRHKTARDLKPEAKENSFNLLAETLLRMSPNPAETNWYSFGFVTCRRKDEENFLVDLYQLLLTKSDGSFFYEFYNSRRGITQPATFTQFWKAYEAGQIIQLMDSKGLKELRSRLPFLEGFLSVPPAGPRPSVWRLKQFLDINDPVNHPPVPSVNVDYGFFNCRNFKETCALMEIYGKVLETANPLELHQACVTGALFQFASDYVRLQEQWRSLMMNFYPLVGLVDSKLEPALGSREASGADEDSAGLPSLLSRLWGFIGGVANS